ncbi:MAG: enterochelin esterase [Planctomycetes bacterium]|nr:enterochelin esterase [Planctomycetota bacterium]
MARSRSQQRLWIALASALVQATHVLAQQAPQFEITCAADIHDKPYAGRVFVLLAAGGGQTPLGVPRWLSDEPFFAQEVERWQPGETLKFDADKAVGYPCRLADLPAGSYSAQAVLVLNRWSNDVLQAPGNGFSTVVVFEHDPGAPPTVGLRITQRLPQPELEDTHDRKYVKLRSTLLSRFYRQDVYLRALVDLPPGYANEPQRRFPTLYLIPGFGGTVAEAGRYLDWFSFRAPGSDLVIVFLDPVCPTGHHVFADSANNGPWGQALVRELIPHLEEAHRLIAHADARYLNGHSSGGWSSLWLQISYPDVFGGVWSTSPDPVDFRAFCGLDVYAPGENVFTARDGTDRPVGRDGPFAKRSIRSMARMEAVTGRGGQLYSFAAVFGPRAADGKVVPLCDPQTGVIDAEVATAWRKYDIRHILESKWETLGPQLAGKLHIYCGAADTFFLDEAVRLLDDSLKKLGSDARIEMIPGAGHQLPRSVFTRIGRQIDRHYQERYVKPREK